MNAVKHEIPDASPTGYADDTGMISTSVEAVRKALMLTGKFATVTGQVLNASKSKTWSTDASRECELHALSLMHERVPCSTGGRLLGAHVAARRGVRNALGEKRVEKGILVTERIRWAPLPLSCRARMLSSLVMPSTMYAFCVGGLTCYQINYLTSAVMRALWGTKRALLSKDIVLSLVVQGRLVDPHQVTVYQGMLT